MANKANNAVVESKLDFGLLNSNLKVTGKRILFGTIEDIVGNSGAEEINPASKYSDKQKMLDITAYNGSKYSVCCEYKLSQMIHNELISMTDLSAMEVCQVPLKSEGPDKGKLVWKVLLPENWSETIKVDAKDLKKAADVQKISLFSPDQLASW